MEGPPRLLFLPDSVGRGLLQTCCSCVGTYPAQLTKHSMTGAISLPYLFTRSHNTSRGIPSQINHAPSLLPEVRDRMKEHSSISQLLFLLLRRLFNKIR
ncbi:hypothetical protein AVEN_203762-1 [Araneus ventricosus]|uniref:Uncharacterized protein n=1 Tax=Araneus ventricosus TaxID=182803 RepID=A0A4Y2GFU9_ARAVE|nr:hypothetical protein AVEN_203762-1 [Araneus ventricosus]